MSEPIDAERRAGATFQLHCRGCTFTTYSMADLLNHQDHCGQPTESHPKRPKKGKGQSK